LTTSVATTSAQLYPGITGANLYLTVNNPNPFAVTVTSVNANGAAVPDAGHAAGCVTTGVTFATQATSQTIGGGASLSFTVPGVAMTNASDNGCQGATFTIPVTFTASS
jgi:P pilus assembly chaperone PapD